MSSIAPPSTPLSGRAGVCSSEHECNQACHALRADGTGDVTVAYPSTWTVSPRLIVPGSITEA